MNCETFLQRIRHLDKLTPSEAKVAAFFESNYPLAAFETIASISHKAGVGNATIVRFLNRLGYKGFSDFMKVIRKDVVARLGSPIDRYSVRRDQVKGEKTDYLGQHIDQISKNLEETKTRMNPEELTEAARLMAIGKGNLYVMGASTSESLAHFFCVLTRYMRESVYLLNTNFSRIRHHLVNLSSQDILLVILHYRFALRSVQVAKWFAKHNCRIILISDKEMTPISDIAHTQFYACSEGSPMFNSRIATLMILESLLAAMAPFLEPQMYSRFEVFEALREEFGTYAQWPTNLSDNKTNKRKYKTRPTKHGRKDS